MREAAALDPMDVGLFRPDGVLSDADRLVHPIEGFAATWLFLTFLQRCLTSLISWPIMDSKRHCGYSTLNADMSCAEESSKRNARNG